MIRHVLLALALLVPAALAQRAPDGASAPPPAALDRYHEGAQAYVGGDLERAAAAVQAGLQMAPNSARLQALRDLIEQEQENQDQRQGGQQNDEGQNQQGDGQGQPGDSGEGEQGEGDEPPQTGEQEAEQDQTRTAPQTPSDEQDGDGSASRRPGEGGATPPRSATAPDRQMSRAQAARILDAVGGDEQLLLREIRRAPTRGARTDRDW